MNKQMQKIYDAGSVLRYHTTRTIQQQTVADHSGRVAKLLAVNFNVSCELLRAALVHDVAEVYTGDIPATFKWAAEDVAKQIAEWEHKIDETLGIAVSLTETERRVLKLCDLGELCLFAMSEVKLGNTYMRPVAQRGLMAVIGLFEVADQEDWGQYYDDAVAFRSWLEGKVK